ncbi:MAG: hypothetical protein IPO75_16000 [Betaproteobacteria bacterium]|nr:hypothetical protein [Betaproteobacteria bacterium]
MVESKNGSVIRKQFATPTSLQHFAADLNAFCARLPQSLSQLPPPLPLPTEEIDAKGKIRKRYRTT